MTKGIWGGTIWKLVLSAPPTSHNKHKSLRTRLFEGVGLSCNSGTAHTLTANTLTPQPPRSVCVLTVSDVGGQQIRRRFPCSQCFGKRSWDFKGGGRVASEFPSSWFPRTMLAETKGIWFWMIRSNGLCVTRWAVN